VHIDEMNEFALQFAPKLAELKAAMEPERFWYPHGTINNIGNFGALLTGGSRDFGKLVGDRPVADIGAADGDMGFLLDALGFDVDIIDYGQTNRNCLWGAWRIKKSIGARLSIHDIDIDTAARLPRRYGLAMFLGILYHLKNPYGALETLARSAEHAIISTRVARVTTDRSTRLDNVPVAYLLSGDELTADPSNYWIFSAAGLRALLDRTGWDIVDWLHIGDTADSDPASSDRDERVFCLVRSRTFG
jgi:tRNA (mo5U34)-methyltransferase